MNTIVSVSISKHSRLSVNVGDKITANTPIAQEPVGESQETIHVAKILNIAAPQMYKYFKKRIGEYINKGEILAEKKGVFSSSIVKSPISAKLVEIDLKKGTLTLMHDFPNKVKKVNFPFCGKVKTVAKDYVEVEVEGEVYETQKGEGKEVVGSLYYFKGEHLELLDVSNEVDSCIVACQYIAEDALVKLEVLDARGLILYEAPGATNISWVQVSEVILKKLALSAGKNVWLRPAQRQIIMQNL